MDPLSISRIRAYAVSPPGMPALRYSGPDELTTRDLEIVRITLANGVEGTGSCDTATERETPGSVVNQVRNMSDRYLGQSIKHRTTLTESLLENAGEGPWEAVSIVDCAMWDAWTRSSGVPLWQSLGGKPDRIETYASTVAFRSIQEYLDEVASCVGKGYRVIKLHLNTEPEFDLDLVRTVATRFPDTRFIVDIEECYGFDDALRLGEVISELPFDWMEAPMPDENIDAYVELNKAVAIDILPAGNTVVGLDHWAEGLRRSAWSRLRCDVTNGGGVTHVLDAMQLARDSNVLVELQSFGYQPTQRANLEVMLGVGGCTYFEHAIPFEPYDYATRNPLIVKENGYVDAGNDLGPEMDWATISEDAFLRFDSDA